MYNNKVTKQAYILYKSKESGTMGRKWNNIKDKKAGKDAANSRIYAKFGREIYVAAKSGEPNPESNRALKNSIRACKNILSTKTYY